MSRLTRLLGIRGKPTPEQIQAGLIAAHRLHVISRQPKIFCIGRNKTGTTSMEQALRDLNFVVGNQREAEILCFEHYFEGNFQPIIEYCKKYQAFQDIPFSYPETYKHLDKEFPDAKFILTVRDSADQWYTSLTRWHAKLWGDGQIPTYEILSEVNYIEKGYALNFIKLYKTPKSDPYNKETLTTHYKKYNAGVIEYFRGRPEKLLVINLADPDSYRLFTQFLGVWSTRTAFPWRNKA